MASFDPPESPTIGSWYEDQRKRRFEVVAFDEEAELVEIQYFDGDVSELELDDWRERVVAEIAAPEDWAGAYDGVESDEMGDTEKPMHPEDWDGPWNELDQES